MWLLALIPAALAIDPLVITVADPAVTEVMLTCDGKTHRAAVVDGVASFTFRPGKCEVSLLTKTGTIDGPAKYACDRRGCAELDVIHRDVGDAAGRLTVVITDDSTRLLEIKCTSGYRARANVETNTAVFEGVPDEDCDLLWKGSSTPTKAFRLRSGTYYCSATGGTGVCKRR